MRLLLLAAALMVASAASGQSLNAPPTAIQAALDHLQTRGPAMGLRAADTDDLAVSSAHLSERSGVAHVYVQQRLGGIDVRGALVSVAVRPEGAVAYAAGELVGGLSASTTQKTAALSPEAALLQASRLVGETLDLPRDNRRTAPSADRATTFGEVNGDAVTARLVYVPTEQDGLRLAWEVVLPTRDAHHLWEVVLDASTGAELARHDHVIHDVFHAPEAVESFAPVAESQKQRSPLEALAEDFAPTLSSHLASSYLVYPMPVEAPIYTSPAPPADGRTAAVDPEDATASPFGWHDTNGAAGAEYTITRGNNVHAYQDRNNSNSSSGDEPDGGASLTFAPSLDLTQDPSAYQDAAVVNLFYWNNIIHDLMVHYGFTEASGNFQQTNYSGNGAGNDYVQAQAQDNALGSGNCNANMSTPPDGSRPRMQMYLCDNTNPEADGDFDNGVIVHEYGHGITIRLTGGASTSSCLNNAEQMGEGWSDYFGMMMTMEA
ncbi:MAG: M36 family metallopeptidase, partial [Bacteroidota bacterium]